MAGFKLPDFNERSAAARTAKQSALDKLREKPAIDPAVVAQRQAVRAAKETAAAEQRAARLAAAEEAKAAKLAARQAEAERIAAEIEANKKPEQPKLTAEERKAARDAKYAARKARKR